MGALMQQIAFVTTTINVPQVLPMYVKSADANTRFFIIGDKKTDDCAMYAFLEPLRTHADIRYYTVTDQAELGYACSPLIGWNCIMRRNIGFLEALKWGADTIISFDDDNVILDPFSYKLDHACTVDGTPASGPCVTSDSGWFDPGTLLFPPSPHRGFPITTRRGDSRFRKFKPASSAKVGVNAGISLGDPDIWAVERIVNAPEVHQVSELLRSGLLVDSRTWTVFNSQNTAVIRDLIPAWGMVPHVGRMDDIYASLITQRVMRDRGLHVHFGQPFVWQQRNEQNVLTNLRHEIDGMEHITHLADLIGFRSLPGKSVIDDCRHMWEALSHTDWMPPDALKAMFAYLDDCEKVMG